ncbi:MAG: hypothetical protein GF308_01955 [Candidatus Heimdallarchaeota archaeon]|nr:hypothetical protein [Candidatus Heimdallarchaeota archaeon]
MDNLNEKQPKQNTNQELPEPKQADQDSESREDFRRSFSLPKNIKRVEIVKALGELVTGGGMITVAVLFIAGIMDFQRTWGWIISVLLVLFGGFLVILFPIDLGKAINSKLILGEKSVHLRNTFQWQEIPWDNLQEIMIRERLSSNPQSNKSIGIRMIRFRTVKEGYLFLAESYPIEHITQMKESLKSAFLEYLKGTGFTINERIERPSMQTRFIFYEKSPEKS